MEKPKHIKEGLFLVEPNRIVAALRKNILYILIGTIGFLLLGINSVKKEEAKVWQATSKIIRYNKQISKANDVPYQFQHFNYITALETIRSRTNLIELIQVLELNGTTTPEEIYSKFEIKRGRSSDIVEIIFTNSDQQLVAKGANVLSQIFIKNFKNVQNAAIERIYEYYIKSKKIKEEEYYQAKAALLTFLKEKGLSSIESEFEIDYKLLNKLNLRKLDNDMKIMEYQTSISEITKNLTTLPDEVKLKYAVRSANKKALEIKIKELKRQKKVYTDEHPKIRMLRSEIAQIKNTIKNAGPVEPDEVTYGTNPIKSNLRITLSKTKIKYTAALDIKLALEKQIKNVKKKLEQLTTINRTYEKLNIVKEDAYAQLNMVSKRLYSLKISIGSSKEDFKIYEKAKVPQFPKPSFKKVKVILLTVGGFFLLTFFIIIREFLDNQIKTKFDLQTRFGIRDTIALAYEGKISKRRKKILSFIKNNIFDKLRKTDISLNKELDLSYQKELTKRDFSTQKKVFSFLANRIIAKDVISPHIITLGSDIKSKEDNIVTPMMLEHLVYQKHKILHIQSHISNSIDEESINLTLPLEEQSFKPKKVSEYIETLFWKIEDDYTIYIPNKINLDKVFSTLKSLDYDYIIIDIPAYQGAEHLVPMFIERTDTFLLCAEFKTSQRKVVYDLMLRIEKKHIPKIKGVVSEIHKYFLS